MKSRVLAVLAGLAALSVCITASAAPLEAYSRLPAMSDVELSADGQNIAYVSTSNEQSRVVVQRLDGQVLQVVELGNVKVQNLLWGSPDHVIISTRTTRSVRNMLLRGELSTAASLNIRTGRAVQFFERLVGGNTYSTALWASPVPGTWEGEPVAYVVVYATGVQGDRIDVVRIDLETGIARTHAMGNEDTYDFLVLPDGSVPAKADYDERTGDWSLSVRDGGGWRVAHRVNEPVDTPEIETLTQGGDAVYMRMLDRSSGYWRHHPVSLASATVGAPTLPEEARGLIRDENMRAVGYVTVGESWDYHFFDQSHQAAWQLITNSLRGRAVSFESASSDFSKLVFYVEGPGHPGNFVLYDARTRSLTQIGRAYPDIGNNEVAQVQAIEYPAADGLTIPAYLTLPLGRSPQNLPLIVMPHGGPQARDYGGFDWMAQGFASRGYAVLQPNFRGSGGYDTAFIEAGYSQWGRKMQTDLSDGIAYLASQGVVNPSRVCIVGGSYGGYAALAGVTLQRDVYRCSVAIAPVSDVRDFLAWRAVRSGEDTSTIRYWTRYLGIEDRNDRRLDEISTVAAAGGDDAPVLLIHGRDDTIVPFSQSEAARNALAAAGRTVELIPLRQEDHYLSREATRIQTLNAAVAFIERHNPPN